MEEFIKASKSPNPTPQDYSPIIPRVCVHAKSICPLWLPVHVEAGSILLAASESLSWECAQKGGSLGPKAMEPLKKGNQEHRSLDQLVSGLKIC